MLSAVIVNAQDSTALNKCYSYYKYELNTTIKTLLPATVINFYGYSDSKEVEWIWDFGDGETSNEQNPLHIYNHPIRNDSMLMPVYPFRTVTLTVLTNDGCSSSFSETINIFDWSDTYEKNCKSGFKYYILANDTAGKTSTFQLTNLSEGSSLSYLWQFDNGTSSTEAEPVVTFDYSRFDRKVCLTVTGDNCADTFCDGIYIKNYEENDYKDTINNCHAWFKYHTPSDVLTIPEVIPYQFNDRSEGEVISWLWEFEDGSSSTEAEPMVLFDFSKPTQNVCLTITTANGCSSTWCETVYVNSVPVDTIYTDPNCNYTIRINSSYPQTASACIGYASALVYYKDSLVVPDYYYWSTGSEKPEVNNLCPTQTYSVTVVTNDGCKITNSFVFNSDGTISEIPIYWWVTKYGVDSYIEYDVKNDDYTVEWILCDGSIITCDSIPFSQINCITNEANLIIKDSDGNVVYSDNLAMRSDQTSLRNDLVISKIELFPNPVKDILNARFSGHFSDEINIEITDMNGKIALKQNFNQVESGNTVQLNVSHLSKGLYIGKIMSNNRLVDIIKFNK